jgi:hypothetical protein
MHGHDVLRQDMQSAWPTIINIAYLVVYIETIKLPSNDISSVRIAEQDQCIFHTSTMQIKDPHK